MLVHPSPITFTSRKLKQRRGEGEGEREGGRSILAMFMPTEQHHHTSPSNIKSGPLLLGHCHQPNTPLLCSRPHRPGNTLTHFPPRKTQKQKLQNETQMRDFYGVILESFFISSVCVQSSLCVVISHFS